MAASAPTRSLNRFAFDATVHCLTGCAIGEVLGMAISTALGWHDLASIMISIVLAFFFGYLLTIRLLRRGGLPFGRAARTAVATDTISITAMEVVDNLLLVAIPGAMAAGLTDLLFWGSLLVSLAVAFVVTLPINRWLISRGMGHAVMHSAHGGTAG